ncbi:unnamed protein product [Jaminaea pallidilutea]
MAIDHRAVQGPAASDEPGSFNFSEHRNGSANGGHHEGGPSNGHSGNPLYLNGNGSRAAQAVGSVSPYTNGRVSRTDNPRPRCCWATLMTGDRYLPGLAVFAWSLLRSPHASTYPLLVMIARNSCTPEAIRVVEQLGCVVVEVDRLDPPKAKAACEKGKNGSANGHATGVRSDANGDVVPPTAASEPPVVLAETRFSEVWAKLRAWQLDALGYERVVLVDSDMLVTRNMDELMDRNAVGLPASNVSTGIAASCACTCNPAKIPTYPKDWVPANCAFTPQTYPSCLAVPTFSLQSDSRPSYHLLNSGLVVLEPSSQVFSQMLQHLVDNHERVITYRFPDQDFLADFFHGNYRPLPYIYNALKKLRASHQNIWRDQDVKNVHYIHTKPWEAKGRDRGGPDELTHSWWWDVFEAKVRPSRAGGVDAKLWQSCIEKYVHAE